MMELGATVCLPNGIPRCEFCPLSALCEARLQNRIADFPVKSGKPPRKIEKKTILVLLRPEECKIALRKRPDKGLLAGLWEFPNFDGELTESEVRKLLVDAGLKISTLVKLKNCRHIFTHMEWEMTGYLAVSEEGAPVNGESSPFDFQWITVGMLEEKLSLPAAFKTYYETMKRFIDKESPMGSNRKRGKE
jgi:A/G-specific adenine glycosylase